MYGYQGKILKVNLTTGKYSIVKLQTSISKKYLGGRGLAGFFLKNKMHLACDDGKLPVVIFTGPLTSCGVTGSSRLTIMSKSPITGGIGDNSSQGKFASMLKKAGFDGIIITGKSRSLVGVEISDSKLVFKNAESHKGVSVSKQFSMLKGKGGVALTGFSADNRVRFSNIYLDGGFTSPYAGLGLIWALKNLKYITVKGGKNTRIFNKAKLLDANKDIVRLINASPFLNGEFGIAKFSSSALLDLCYTRNLLSGKHFKNSRKTNPLNFNAPSLLRGNNSDSLHECSCFLDCKKKIDKNHLMPEFEALAAISSFSETISKETILKAYNICCDAGMDVVSSVGVISTYQAIGSKKISSTSFLSLLVKISRGEQDGMFLKEGAYLYAKSKGQIPKESDTENMSSNIFIILAAPLNEKRSIATGFLNTSYIKGKALVKLAPIVDVE